MDMKRLFLTICTFLSFGVVLSAQTNTNLYDFINSLDWNMTESQFFNQYESMLTSESIEGEHAYQFAAPMNIGKYPLLVMLVYATEKESPLMKENGITLFAFPDVSSYGIFNKNSIKELNDTFIKEFNAPTTVSDLSDMHQEQDFLDMFGADADNSSMFICQISNPTIATITDLDSFFCVIATSMLSDTYLNAPEKDFRHSNWGDSMADVMQVEKKDNIIDIPGIYAFEDYLGGKPVSVIYRFTDDKLYFGKYFIDYDYSSKRFMDDYEYYLSLLTKKYGEPLSSEKKLLKGYEPSYLTEAELVSQGYTRHSTLWLNISTTIGLFVYLNDYSCPCLAIEYSSLQYSEENEENTLDLL